MPIFFISPKIAIKSSPIHGKGVFANTDVKKGEILIDIAGKIVHKSSYFTLQIGPSTYLLEKYIDNYINHACTPNIVVKLHKNNKKRVTYVALTPIKKGKELFWNYNTTEWDAEKYAFRCKCTKRCINIIKGMKYSKQKTLRHIATPYIKQQLKIH